MYCFNFSTIDQRARIDRLDTNHHILPYVVVWSKF